MSLARRWPRWRWRRRHLPIPHALIGHLQLWRRKDCAALLPRNEQGIERTAAKQRPLCGPGWLARLDHPFHALEQQRKVSERSALLRPEAGGLALAVSVPPGDRPFADRAVERQNAGPQPVLVINHE